MIKKIIFILFLLYVLTLIQSSFLVHFRIFGVVPNLVLILVVLINLFTSPSRNGPGFFSAIVGGFFLDVFSSGYFGFFGFYTLFLLLLSFFLNFILKKYIKIPELQQRVEKRIYPL